MPFWPETPYSRLRLEPPAQARFLSSKPECLFLRNHDKLGALPLPNGDSFKPLDSVELALAELAPDSAFAADTLGPRPWGPASSGAGPQLPPAWWQGSLIAEWSYRCGLCSGSQVLGSKRPFPSRWRVNFWPLWFCSMPRNRACARRWAIFTPILP